MAGTVRAPRAWVNGINVLECRVTLVRASSGSTMEAVMALDDPSNPGPAYWGDTAPLPVEVTGTNGDGKTNVLFEGFITIAEVDFTERVVRVQGIDKTLDFEAQRNDQKYPNMTTDQVVQQIAGEHGCSVNSDGGSDMAGKTFDGQEYAFNTDVQSDWDAIQTCAEQDGKIAYISNGNILNYVNPGDMPAQGNYTVTYVPPTPESYEDGSVVHLQCTRDIQIGEGVQGQAASWNTRDKQSYTSSTGQQ